MIVACFLLSMVLLVDVSSVICGTEVTHLIYMVVLLRLAHTRALIIPSSCRFSTHQHCLHCQTTTGLMDGAAASSSTTTQESVVSSPVSKAMVLRQWCHPGLTGLNL
jgi:hypothetical protein